MPNHQLSPKDIVETVRVLRNRINERFPDAGLTTVCEELLKIAEQASQRSIAIGRPMLGVRILSGCVIAAILIGVLVMFNLVKIPNQPIPASEFIQVVDAAFNALVLVGATLLFLFTLEVRVKRSRALKAIHELRSLVHIIDMHQLTKDPERMLWRDASFDTKSSPKRTMNRFQLNRYLDYCSEMLALCGKVAALYVANFHDSQAVAAVNDLENLTTGQGGKIWQKIMILHSVPEHIDEVQQVAHASHSSNREQSETNSSSGNILPDTSRDSDEKSAPDSTMK